MRRAKIIATIGPASQSPSVLRQLIQAGMDVARLNFSHGTHETYGEIIQEIRTLSDELDKPVAVLQDLQGPKIRTGSLERGRPVKLKTGQSFKITTRPVVGNSALVSTSYESLPGDVKPGDRILLSDGLIHLRVFSTSKHQVRCEVLSGGALAENQGINIPGVIISAPPLTEKDLHDLDFGIEQKVDYIALSFVRRPVDLLSLKRKLQEKGSNIPVIAKLEKPQAIENLDAIMDACEGVMVARGDLGVEMSPERVPVIQKHIIKEANSKGKLVITATQMLESMVSRPLPTRAEASDVANAVFDGTDALMLSGETARGQFPIESVQMMAKIIFEAEKLGFHSDIQPGRGGTVTFPEAVCEAAYHAAHTIRAKAIIAFTQTGATAKMISKYRPAAEILAFTPHQQVVNRMSLFWGVKPMLMDEISNVDELIRELERLLLREKLVKKDDNLIILTGAPLMEKGHTSLMKLHAVKG